MSFLCVCQKQAVACEFIGKVATKRGKKQESEQKLWQTAKTVNKSIFMH